ncbi:hypothetical protein GUJ93_ZPchr0003g17941 [Zizania palustris]|uniref:Uncharacterized protein n=1 Tax=Zizania palustris TaxID=103762 RepID=A0A8J5S323_ZIZPA|nr:hypothetical protein GUJ93_ZPchr0003g17941 [Zizania palustris]
MRWLVEGCMPLRRLTVTGVPLLLRPRHAENWTTTARRWTDDVYDEALRRSARSTSSSTRRNPGRRDQR